MPGIEINWSFVYGLGVIAIIFVAVLLIAKLALSFAMSSTFRNNNREAFETLVGISDMFFKAAPYLAIAIFVVWLGAFVTSGGIIWGDRGEPTEELVEEVSGELFSGENKPEVRSKELRKDGQDLQDEKMESLKDFRKDFLKNRKETPENEEGDN